HIYTVIEALAAAGVKVGLPRDVATQLAAQTVLGSGAMVLETGEHPAKLKDIVTTPSGCTIAGILELEDGGLRVTLIKAVVRATHRAKEPVNGYDWNARSTKISGLHVIIVARECVPCGKAGALADVIDALP